jgi:small subunit ribosomal protein S17
VMAEDNEKSQDEEAKDEATEAADEQPAAEEQAEDRGSDEEAADAPAEEPAADVPAAAEASSSDGETPEEELSPKQKRKLERSRASGPPGPQLSHEQRAEQRAERRSHAAEQRSRHRRRRREKRGTGGSPRGTGTPAAERAPGPRKIRQGTVVSTRSPKTITVRVEIKRRHPTYEKVVRRSSTLRAHDEAGEANEGDVVRVVESRPLSRTKRWRLLDVLERAR